MDYDALILAGGRSARLGGVPKSRLMFDGATLLDRAVAAAGGATRTVVVGPVDDAVEPKGEAIGAGRVLFAREDPPYSGPAAAIAAGLAALAQGRTPMPFTLVLACDMPLVAQAVPGLLAACESGAEQDVHFAGVVAESADGRSQPLAGFYSTRLLQKSAYDLASRGTLINGSVRALLANLGVAAVAVPAGSTDDVDTWADADALGVARAETHNGSGQRLDEATLEADGEDAGPDS